MMDFEDLSVDQATGEPVGASVWLVRMAVVLGVIWYVYSHFL